QEDSKVQEVVEVVNAAKLITEVVTSATTQGVVIRDPEEELHDDIPAETQFPKDKGKGILVEDPKPMKKKDQIAMDAEYARKLQEEEESLAQTKDAQATDVQLKDALAKRIQYIRRYHGLREQAKEAKDLKKQLEVVADEDDDVFIEATLIGTKVRVVNHEVVMINNKP
nr:hypothetical protein [Tanacetum cinerariifolium]